MPIEPNTDTLSHDCPSCRRGFATGWAVAEVKYPTLDPEGWPWLIRTVVCTFCHEPIVDLCRYPPGKKPTHFALHEVKVRAELGTRSPRDARAELLGRLEAIPAGTQVRLSYIPEGKQSSHDQFTVEAIGVDRAANVYRFKKGDLRDHLDSAPLNDVEDSWIGPDGTPFISLSGCMVPPDKNPFHPFRYKSRPRGGART